MKNSRANQILEYLQTHGHSAKVSELCKAFHVSDMTIRRDLQYLEENEKVIRHHGGASLISASPEFLNAAAYQYRLYDQQNLKLALGATAAEHLRTLSESPNCNSVFIASGSTMICIATQINFPLPGTMLVTDNLHVAQVLGSNPEYTVISIGGQLLLPSLNAVGHVAENMIRSFNYNYAFIGVGSIDEQGYLYYYNMMESGTFTAIIESAQHVVVVADSTKFEKKAFLQLCQLREGFTLITDSGIPPKIHDTLVANGTNVIINSTFSVE